MMKNTLLIGASGGVGLKVGETLLSGGYKVIGTYYQHPERLDVLNSNSNFKAHYIDLKQPDTVKELLTAVREQVENLYAVVNCAGICRFEGNNLTENLQIWHETMATNLSGNYYVAQYFQEMLQQNGRFIMISSTDANFGGDITASYAASKSGINSLTKSLSLLFQEKSIRVNSIAPGWIETPMIEDNGPEFIQKVADINPLKRNAKPLDVANFITFLLSDKSDYLNGQVIALEGGYTNQDPTLLLESELIK